MLLQGKYQEANGRISPDGRWLAYVSDESRQPEVYVRPFPEINKERWLVSNGFGLEPLWSQDGRKLFYWTQDALMEVAVDTDPTFNPEVPKVLLSRKPAYTLDFGISSIAWDAHPDGKRYLVLKPNETVSSEGVNQKPKFIIVTNWFEELKEKVPVP